MFIFQLMTCWRTRHTRQLTAACLISFVWLPSYQVSFMLISISTCHLSYLSVHTEYKSFTSFLFCLLILYAQVYVYILFPCLVLETGSFHSMDKTVCKCQMNAWKLRTTRLHMSFMKVCFVMDIRDLSEQVSVMSLEKSQFLMHSYRGLLDGDDTVLSCRWRCSSLV